MAFIQHEHDTVTYLTSALIPARHCFTTRLGGVSEGIFESMNLRERSGDAPEHILENYRRIGEAAGIDTSRMVHTRQTHSKYVRTVTAADARALFEPDPPECDGLVTNQMGVPLIIFTADCVPVLLCDPKNGVIGAVHCGWRGTVADILGETVKAMTALGAEARHIRAAIGPAIGKCCFETGPEVPEAMERWLGGRFGLCPPEPGVPGKFLVDLRGGDRLRLMQLGLREENIDISPECTMCAPDKFWSHRVTRGRRGCQAAIISL